jgi:hypothetical protein
MTESYIKVWHDLFSLPSKVEPRYCLREDVYIIVLKETLLDGLSKKVSDSELGPHPGSVLFAV